MKRRSPSDAFLAISLDFRYSFSASAGTAVVAET